MVAVLFVCLGNICRSPAGEGVLRRLIEIEKNLPDIEVASCGIGGWHIGQLPDSRMREAANDRGIVLATRAQQFESSFLDRYDYILAADHDVLKDLFMLAKTPEQKAKVHLITRFSRSYPDQEVPDPYYGGNADFDLVLDMLQDSCEGLISEIRKSIS